MTLTCKRCEREYKGDPFAVAVCDPCFDELQNEGWDDEELFASYPPTDEVIEEEEEAEGVHP